MQLSNREIKITLLLLEMENPITAKGLSEHFEISVRMIKYDLDNVRDWLNYDKKVFYSKRNKGFWIEAGQKQREELKQRLLSRSEFEYYPVPEQRVSQLITIMCLTDGYITGQKFENKMNVSKTTIVGDLNRVEERANQYSVRLDRKNYYGYSLVGSEKNIRGLFESVLQHGLSNYDVYETMNLLASESTDTEHAINFGMNTEIENVFKIVLERAVKNKKLLMQAKFDDDDLLTIMIRMVISIIRLSINHPMNSYHALKLAKDEQDVIYQIAKQVNERYGYSLLEDEYSFIIGGTQSLGVDEKNIAKMTDHIISYVSKKTSHAYVKDQELQNNLFFHMMKLTSKYQFTNEYNPFVDDIKKNHLALFNAIYEASKDEISSDPAIVNDSFVAYIALHFLVSLETENVVSRNVRIVYVCSTGLGVTNLVQKKIQEEIDNVEIAGFTSYLNAAVTIRSLEPDLVVSIFPLNVSDTPVIRVSPLPSKQDIEKIKNEVVKLGGKLQEHKTPNKAAESITNLKDGSRDIILKGFAIFESIKTLLPENFDSQYLDALLLHVLMSVHRIYFAEQYDQKNDHKLTDDEMRQFQQVKDIYGENGLSINQSEILALGEYLTLVTG